MTWNPTILKGTIHGRSIELEAEPGLPDGQQVTVTVQPMPQRESPPLDALEAQINSWIAAEKAKS